MTTSATLPPFHLDVRIADSPVVGMRFQLDGRAGELEDVIAELEQERDRVAVERRGLRVELGRAEEERQTLLDHRTAVRGNALHTAFERSASLYERLRAAEERVDGLNDRIEGLRSQVSTIRELSHRVADLVDLDELRETGDEPVIRYRQAERQLLHLVDEDQASTAHVLSKPMEELADAALAVELAGRRAVAAPEEAAQVIAHCREATRHAMEEMNRLLFRLSPQELVRDGLVTSVRRLVADVNQTLPTRLQLLGDEQKLVPETALAAFRIVEEALDNAVRHSHGQRAEVILSYSRVRLTVLVTDNGEGFDVPGTEARLGRTQTVGLISMPERADLAGGTYEVRSVLGVGTEVRATFDLNVAVAH